MPAGTSNFKVFNESLTDIQDDATYEADTQRINGVAPGQARSVLHNKLYRQVSIMAAALGQFIANEGYNANDTDLNALITAIGNTFATTKDLADAIGSIPGAPVTSVNTKTGDVVLAASDIKAADNTTLEAFKTSTVTSLADILTNQLPLKANQTDLNQAMAGSQLYLYKNIGGAL